MKNLIGYVNAGYEIVLQGREAVLAHSKSKDEWVAWHYEIEDDKPCFCLGRYGGENSARIAFDKKERGENSSSY